MKEFDLRTHIRSPKGDIVSKQPYRMKIKDGKQMFERPVGSGHWVAQNGEVLIQGDTKATETKIAYQTQELEALLADAQAKLQAYEAEAKGKSVEPARAPLTESRPQAQTKDVSKNK